MFARLLVFPVLAWMVLVGVACGESNAGGGRGSLVLAVPPIDRAVELAVETPARAALPGGSAQLVEIGDSGVRVPVQWSRAIEKDGQAGAEAHRLLACIPPGRDAQSPRRFRLEPQTRQAPESSQAFRFAEASDASLRLLEGNRPVFAYNHGVITKEEVPKDDPRRTRACYIHPLWGLDGEVLTDDFPKDHFHHHGVFWSWPHVRIEGSEYDLWVGKGITLRFVRWLCRETGPLAATLAVENGWFVGDRKVMVERVWMRTYKAAEGSQSLDLEFAWIPTDKPVTLWGAEGKSYGGLTVRYGPRPSKDTIITVPDGRTKADLYETQLAWADFTGPFEGRTQASGAAVLVHPSHPDYPPTWLTRHYGCLCVGWPGVRSRTFEPGEIIRIGYRIWIHRGERDGAELGRVYASYKAAAASNWEHQKP